MPDAAAPLPRLSLPIEGMTCAACAGRVERALRKVPGVAEVQVNPATDRAEVLGSASVASLKQAVEGAGYGVAAARFDLAIGGMTCAKRVPPARRRQRRSCLQSARIGAAGLQRYRAWQGACGASYYGKVKPWGELTKPSGIQR